MKIISILQRLILVIFLLNTTFTVISQSGQPKSDTLIRVGITLNGTVLPDSLFLVELSGGTQVEARKFMESIGGLYYPISHIFHQDGIILQYGRFISFARLGFTEGFVSLEMVDMSPPVTKQLIGTEEYEFFAPMEFLRQTISGGIVYNNAAGRLEVTAATPSEFGSIFPPAFQVATALQDSGYIVRMGEANKQYPIQYCQAGYTDNANGNNVGVPYFGIQLPAPPGMDSLYSIPLNYCIKEDEAVILVGKTPPACKYFSYRSYLMNRYYEFPNPVRVKINASLGETTSLYRMRPDLPLDSMFGRKFAVIMTGDSIIAMQVRQTILAATPEIQPEDIFFDILPRDDLFRFGTDPKADWINFLHRVSLFDDTIAGNAYLDNPPLEVIRATRSEPSVPSLFSLHEFLPTTSGISEFDLFSSMQLLENSLYDTYHDNYNLIWLSSTPVNMESFTAIQQGSDALGDNHDCLYIRTDDFILGENDMALAYGVDHNQTGQAVYSNVIIYGKEYYDGFGGITNFMMAKSARQYLLDTSIADRFFVYTFSRQPVPDNPYVFVVPTDPNHTLSGINLEDSALLCTRIYVNSVTKISPDPLEVIIDRFVLLRPKTAGVDDAEITIPSVLVYPNPVKDKAKIEVEVPEWSEVEMSLFNTSGQQLGKTIRFDHVRGTVWQELNFGSGYPSGIYYLKVTIREFGTNKTQVMTTKIVLL